MDVPDVIALEPERPGHNGVMTTSPETPADHRRLVERLRLRMRQLAPDAELLVAVSGGADSVAALRLLLAAGFTLTAAHYNHRLRSAADDDETFVRRLCHTLGVELHSGGADVAAIAAERGWNLEDAARRLRYDFLHRTLSGLGPRAGAIVVAHTLEDQAETMLLQLLRGAAFPGGMAPRRGAVIRPLLTERRGDLRAYLRALDQPWREDATNLDVAMNRAWLRHQLLPKLEERFPDAQVKLAQAADQQRAARAALESEAERRFPTCEVRAAALAAAPAALQRSAIAQRIRHAGAEVNARLLTEIEVAVKEAAADASTAPWQLQLAPNTRARVAYGRFEVVREAASPITATQQVTVTSPTQLPPGVSAAALHDRGELQLRRRQPGDYMQLAAGRKLLSDLLVDRKVPRHERDSLQVLADGAEVLWVEGVEAAPGIAAQPPDADRYFMLMALEQARLAAELGEVPVGAVVIQGGEVIAAAHNLTASLGDPTAHAERLALSEASERLGDWRLSGASLYVTLEPCPMCYGAVLQTRLKRLVFGADNRREGALGGVADLRGLGWKRQPQVRGGVEALAAAKLLQTSFAARREP